MRVFLRQLLKHNHLKTFSYGTLQMTNLPFASFATDRTLLPSLEDSPLLDFEAVSFFLSTSLGFSFEVLSLLSPFTSLSSLLSFFASAFASAVSVLGLLRFAPLNDLINGDKSTKRYAEFKDFTKGLIVKCPPLISSRIPFILGITVFVVRCNSFVRCSYGYPFIWIRFILFVGIIIDGILRNC